MGNRKCFTMFKMPLWYSRLLSLYPGSEVGMSERYLHLQAPCTVKEKIQELISKSMGKISFLLQNLCFGKGHGC